jgi:hypothetical protein
LVFAGTGGVGITVIFLIVMKPGLLCWLRPYLRTDNAMIAQSSASNKKGDATPPHLP